MHRRVLAALAVFSCSCAIGATRAREAREQTVAPTIEPATDGPDPFAERCPPELVRAVRFGDVARQPVATELAGRLCAPSIETAFDAQRACATRANEAHRDRALAEALQAHHLQPITRRRVSSYDGMFAAEPGRELVPVSVSGGGCAPLWSDTELEGAQLTVADDGSIVLVRLIPQTTVRRYPWCGCRNACGVPLPRSTTWLVLEPGEAVARTIDVTFPSLKIDVEQLARCPAES